MITEEAWEEGTPVVREAPQSPQNAPSGLVAAAPQLGQNPGGC